MISNSTTWLRGAGAGRQSSKRLIQQMMVAAALLFMAHGLFGQLTAAEKTAWLGDAPATAPPLASDLSPELTRKNVSHAIQKVADWQLTRAEAGFNQDWTFAALYIGFMAVPKAADEKKYQDAMLQMAKKFNWQLGPRLAHADDQAIGQTYLELYFRDHDPAMIAPTRERMDAVMALPDDPEKPLWWWCDALFMAPPVLARMYVATGDRMATSAGSLALDVVHVLGVAAKSRNADGAVAV